MVYQENLALRSLRWLREGMDWSALTISASSAGRANGAAARFHRPGLKKRYRILRAFEIVNERDTKLLVRVENTAIDGALNGVGLGYTRTNLSELSGKGDTGLGPGL